MKALCIALAMLLLTACTHNRWRTEEARAHYEAQREAIAGRQPLFELRAAEGQTIVLQGVSALIVHDPREQQVTPLPQPEHPVWAILRATLPSLVTGYVGLSQARYSRDISREQYSFLGRVIDAAQPSIHVGGDYVTGQVGDNIGRDYITGQVGDYAGRDQVGGDQTHAGRDIITGDRNHNRGRQDSPGPIIDDHSGDCREGADCSAPPPPPDTDPEG
jgi:hypothetical protein